MAGIGPPPKDPSERRRREPPGRGDWVHAPGVGWQHGEVPPPPTKLLKASRDAWATWMASWVAAHWAPELLPGLRQLIRLYDRVERGEFQRAGELRLTLEVYGLTPKGVQDRRWKPPAEEEAGRGRADRGPRRPDPRLQLIQGDGEAEQSG